MERPLADWRLIVAVAGAALSALSVPLMVSEKVLGTLNVATKERGSFDGLERHLQALAALLAPYVGLQRFESEKQVGVWLRHACRALLHFLVQGVGGRGAAETTRMRLVLFGMQNRTSVPFREQNAAVGTLRRRCSRSVGNCVRVLRLLEGWSAPIIGQPIGTKCPILHAK
jgi:hypothetical protein